MLDRLGTRLTPPNGSDANLAEALRSAYSAAAELGGAAPGDKTMLDAFLPFCDEFSRRTSAGDDLATAWAAASSVARQAALDTAQLRPRMGRARPLAERSLGNPDPGAISSSLCVEAVGEALQL
jgi:dihydroxyacetone kinase